jgi:hypothetical protein
MRVRNCKICNEKFYSQNHRKAYCSDECRHEGKKISGLKFYYGTHKAKVLQRAKMRIQSKNRDNKIEKWNKKITELFKETNATK